MATLRPSSRNSRANFSTTGVLPVPPTVRLPMAMTCTPSVESRRILKLYKNRLVFTRTWKTFDRQYRSPRTEDSFHPLRSSRMTSKRKVSPLSRKARTFSNISIQSANPTRSGQASIKTREAGSGDPAPRWKFAANPVVRQLAESDLLSRYGPIESGVRGFASDKKSAARLDLDAVGDIKRSVKPPLVAQITIEKVSRDRTIRLYYQKVVAPGWIGPAGQAGRGIAAVQIQRRQRQLSSAFKSAHQVIADVEGNHRRANLNRAGQINIQISGNPPPDHHSLFRVND